jgi:proteasome lid subunit RPN8/RPN11
MSIPISELKDRRIEPDHRSLVFRPRLRIAAQAYRHILCSLMPLPPEAGGLLLGPINCQDITEFFFDGGAACTASTYSPDHATLNRHMQDRWIPAGLDMKGFVHSHPRGCPSLSDGDLAYIRRLLSKNQDMSIFAAPVVLPSEYRFCPFVVQASDARQPVPAELVLF